MRIIRGLYLTNWFFIALLGTAFCFVLAFLFPFLMVVGQSAIITIMAILFLELFILFYS